MTQGGEDEWEVSFLVQYRDDGTNWNNFEVADGEAKRPLIVTVGGDNTASEAYTLVEDLPGLPNRQYRAVELQPRYDASGDLSASIVEGGGTFHTAYLTTYVHEPMTETVPPEGENTGEGVGTLETQPLADNALDGETPDGPEADYTTTATNTLQTTKVFAEKKWENYPEEDKTYDLPDVTLKVQYLKEPEAGVTVDAEYRANDANWTDVAGSDLDLSGATDEPGNAFREYDSWHAVWENLPVYLPGSYMPIVGEGESATTTPTQYRVVEVPGDGYIQVGVVEESKADENGAQVTTPGVQPPPLTGGQPEETPGAPSGDGKTYPLFLITNKPATTFTVGKVWNSAPAEAAGWDVVVGLYRNTDGTRDGAEEDKVLVDGKQVTCVLNTTDGLYYEFTGLEKYDEDGNLYTYYARELSVNGETVVDEAFRVTVDGEGIDFIVEHEDDPGNRKTTITNRVEGEIAVHKVWWDGNALNRPESVTVGLYRQDGEALEPVPKPGTDDHYTLMLSAPDWTGTFEDLDEYADGQKITYVVRELEEVEAPPVIEETPPGSQHPARGRRTGKASGEAAPAR